MPWNFSVGYPMTNDSDHLELRINIVEADVTKTLLLDPEVAIYQLCEVIRKNIREAQTKQPKNYGLFLPQEDWRKGLWLDTTKTLQHYIIRRGDTLQYKNRFRLLHIRTMDGIKKELKVDDSWTVAELMLPICTKLGIYNYDEYSLISENDELSPSGEKTLSMKRPMSLVKDHDKLDKLKRKYHTEDGLNWLNPSQSLRQQGIEETESLLLKRKFFFSDMNVDSRDPIQLSLLYVQLKEAVIDGAHPVTIDEAIELAGIQCQIQFGNYSPEKFKSGFLDLGEFLPKEYLKTFKNVEKKIFVHHSQLKDVSEDVAKEKYCLLCRSLKTYGITFFLVKEKVKGKNKLIPRLLGVNKENVVQVDDKSKEIINKWPLTSIKKWAASFSGFTMDFGEYSPDEYYTAQTDKGEKISQIIAGYIDIILKRKKAKDHLGVDGDEESVMSEENISPSRGVIVEHVPKHPRPTTSDEDVVVRKSARTTNSSVRYSSQASDSIYSQDAEMSPEDILLSRQTSLARTQSPDSSMTTNSLHYRMSDDDIRQKLYIMSLQDHLSTIETYKEQLTVNEGPMLGKDEASQRWIYVNMDNSRQRMADDIGAMNAAVAQVIRSARGLSTIEEGEENEMNEEMIARMQNSFSLITVHLPGLIEEIKTSAYYQDQLIYDGSSGEDLILAAKRLADAFTDLLKAAYPIENQNRNLNRQAIFDAANAVGEASNDLLQHITEQETSCDEITVERPISIIFLSQQEQCYQDELLRLAKMVGYATTDLIKHLKDIAKETEDANDQKNIVTATIDIGIAISQLISTTKIVARTIEQPVCQEQLIYCIQDVTRFLVVTVEIANKATTSDKSLGHTNACANDVQQALDNLMRHLKKDVDKNTNLDRFLSACENIQAVCDTDDNPDLLIETRKLIEATNAMIYEMQSKANSDNINPELREQLIRVATALTNVSTELNDNIGKYNDAPEDTTFRYLFQEIVERFIIITYTTECAEIIQEQVINHLLIAAKNATTASTHLINTSQSATKKSRASNYKVCSDGQEVSQRIPKMIIAIKEARRNPKDHLTQLELISSCRFFIDPSEQLAQSSKYMWPTISDPSLQNALNQSIKQSVNATDELKRCLHQADTMCRHLDLSAALEQLKRLQQYLDDIKKSTERENLIPLPDEKADESVPMLIKSVRNSKSVGEHFKHDIEDRCVTYQQNPGEDKYLNLNNLDAAGKKARDLSSELDRLVQAARSVAANIRTVNQMEVEDMRDSEKAAQLQIINCCHNAVDSAYDLVSEAKISPPDCEEMNRIQVAYEHFTEALSRCLNSLPGQRDLDNLNQYIENRKHRFATSQLQLTPIQQTAGKNYPSELTDATFDLNQGVNDLVSAQSSNTVIVGCEKFKSAYDNIVNPIYAMITSTLADNQFTNHHILSNKDAITNGVMIMSDNSQSFVKCVKIAQRDPDSIDHRIQVQDAARTLLDSVNRLLAITSSNIRPGQKECDKAILKMESVRPILDNPFHPVSHKDYYGCLDVIVEKAGEPLQHSLQTIPLSIKDNNSQNFIDSVYQCADCICQMLEETAQAAYLIGIGDVHSKVGTKGLTDHSLFLKIQKEISENCRTIHDPETGANQRLIMVGQISENCEKLVEASKTVIVSFPSDKQKLSDKTKSIPIAVDELRKAVEKVNTNVCDEARPEVDHTCDNIQMSVAQIVELMFSYNFAGETAYISDEAQEAQAPIKAGGITVLDAAIEVVQSSKNLISQEPNEELYFNYSSNGKDLNDALGQLISIIKESAPGQKECGEALILVAKLLRHVRDSKMRVMKNRPRIPSKGVAEEEAYLKVLRSILLQMPHCVDDLSKAGKMESEQLAHVLPRLTQFLESMTDSGKGAATHADLTQNSTIYLEHVATVLEACEQFLKVIKTGGGNPKALTIHAEIDDMAQCVKESCEDLVAALGKISVRQGSVETIVETIEKSSAKVQETAILPDGAKFSNAQSKMLKICYIMNNLTTDLSENSLDESTHRLLAPLAHKLTQNYDELCLACQSAVATFDDGKKRHKLQECVQLVGSSSVELIKSTAEVQPNIESSVHQLKGRTTISYNRINHLIQVLIDCNIGTQACSDAIRILKEINEGIEVTKGNLLSNSTKSLNNGHYIANNRFDGIKSSVISCSNSLVDNIKEIVSKDDSDLDKLSGSANLIVSITKDISSQIQGCTYNSNQSHIQLLNALQEVIRALIGLLEEARSSCDLHYKDQGHETLKNEGKRCVNAITKLLTEFVSLSEDNIQDYSSIDVAITELERDSGILSNIIADTSRATPARSIASTNRLSICSDISFNLGSAPEEFNRLIPSLSIAKDRILTIISPNKSPYRQNDIIEASKYCTNVNSELVAASKNLVGNDQVSEAKLKTIKAAKDVVDTYVILLKNLRNHLDNQSKQSQSEMVNSSRQISEYIKSLRCYLDSLREGPKLIMYFRPSSPEWRDVSEKYIGRHVAYHHCYVKSYSTRARTSTRRSDPTNLVMNGRDPTDVDVNNARRQINYFTNKLSEINPTPNLIGNERLTVAEIDQMLAYVRDLGTSAELLLTTTYSICMKREKEVSDTDSKKNVFRSAIGVANAMKDLYDAIKSLLTSETMIIRFDDKISAATKKIANSTAQILFNLKSQNLGNDLQIENVNTLVRKIRADADLLLQHIAYICDKKAECKSNATYAMLPINEAKENHEDISTTHNHLEKITPELHGKKLDHHKLSNAVV